MELNQFITMIVGGLFSGVVIYIVKGFFTNLEDRVKRCEDAVNGRLNIIESKVNILAERYGVVFNEILIKFSSWEDRVKKIMEEYQKTIPSGGVTGDIASLDKLMKEEMKSISKEVVEIENTIKELNHGVRIMESKGDKFADVLNSFKVSLSKIRTNISEVKEKIDDISDDHNKKLSTLFSVCKSMNTENQKLARRIEEVAELSKTKITLK